MASYHASFLFLKIKIKSVNTEETPRQTNQDEEDWENSCDLALLLIFSLQVVLPVNSLCGGVRPGDTFLRQC